MHPQRLVTLAASVVGILANFLPMATIGPSLNITVTGASRGDALFAVPLFILAAISAFRGDRGGGFTGKVKTRVLVLASVNALLCSYTFYELTFKHSRATIELGIGLYLLVGAALALLLAALWPSTQPSATGEGTSKV